MLIRVPPKAFDPTPPVEHDVDDRRLMAYAGGLGDTSPALFDLDHPGGIVAHPVFPVCLEWPIMVHGAMGVEFLNGDPLEGMHSGHEITWHRPIRGGERLRTDGRLLSLTRKRTGVLVLVELRTVDAAGAPVVTTRESVFYVGAELEGGDVAAEHEPSPLLPEVDLAEVGGFTVTLVDSVVYSETAQIYNAIHTDIRVARAAGLPDGPLIAGSATFAHCVSLLSRELLGGDPTPIVRLGCRFAGPVPMPSDLRVFAGRAGDVIRFEAQTGPGVHAITDGFLTLG
ncbi:unannotated protein [freshwater metagenome]|uniref:Unannotated protein n=1 Tax=freshwater metagenome TaxID=449393 RepID=A0A6J7E129_9ZZZZ|nr:hypothetical protein [Actinomycetota bacterium]